MKNRLLLAPLLAATLLSASGLAGADYQTIELQPEHLPGMTVGFNLLLPQDYATSKDRYPVLYLLHGYTDHYPAWVSYTDLVHHARKYSEIIVMPEGDNGFYTNSYSDPKLAWEDFLIKDLIPYMDNHYRTIATRQGRAIAGLSMGGYGALKLGLKHPEMFAAIASLSGALAAAERGRKMPIENEAFQNLMDGVYGPDDDPERMQEDPFELIKNLQPNDIPQLYIAIGSEDLLLEENRRFVKLLSDLKIPYEYREVPGKHEWPVWESQIQKVLEHQAPVIGSLREAPKPVRPRARRAVAKPAEDNGAAVSVK